MPVVNVRNYLVTNRFDPSLGIRQIPNNEFERQVELRNLQIRKYRNRNTLLPNQQLCVGDQLISNNHLVSLIVHNNGNVLLKRLDNGLTFWSSNTSTLPVNRLVMQDNGDLQACDLRGTSYWESHTSGHPGSRLVVENDGNMVILDNANRSIWSTNTKQVFELNLTALFGNIKDLIFYIRAFGENNRDEMLDLVSMAGFLWDDKQKIFYSKIDPWQHNFGYLNLYDELSPMAGMFIHCEPVRFKIGNKSWKIEFWKGRYGFLIGAEIGVYTGEFEIDTGLEVIDRSINNLDSDKDTRCATGEAEMLHMSFELYCKNKLLFRRNSDDPATPEIEKHWWLTGFKMPTLDKLFVDYNDLVMKIRIAFNDVQMMRGFETGLRDLGYNSGTDYSVYESDTAVNVTFKKPRTTAHQPFLQP